MARDKDTPRRAKTSSERGRAFRERERTRQTALELDVAALEREIGAKTFLRSIWQAKYFRSRHSKFGPLVKLLEEYYSIVRHGVQMDGSSRSGRDVHPEEFLVRATHPDAILGDVVGPRGMVDQWKIYTSAHGRYETQLYGVEVRGPDEDPVVFGKLGICVRLTRKTFQKIFPYATNDEFFIQSLIGKTISYSGTTLVRFTADMRILVQEVHISFVEGLIAAGVPLADVQQLMRGSAITSTCTIVDRPVKAKTLEAEYLEFGRSNRLEARGEATKLSSNRNSPNQVTDALLQSTPLLMDAATITTINSPSSLSEATVLPLPVAHVKPHVETLRYPRPPAKTSSERGKAFRARRKQQQDVIAKQNAVHSRRIHKLLTKKSVYETNSLRAAHTPAGSLERLVREYYSVFDHGYKASGCALCPHCGCNKPQTRRALAQTAFVMQAVDDDARIGDASGRTALIEQWCKYQHAHAGDHVPDIALVQRLDELDATYDCAARFGFTASGRLGSADFDIDFIGGLQRAGLTLEDITHMLGIVPM